jgi:hypothetical protein
VTAAGASSEVRRKARAEHASFVIHAGWDPRLDPLRGDPRFGALLAEIGLPRRAGL